MAASYKKLFKLLIDREMKSKDLAIKAGISQATLAKMKINSYNSLRTAFALTDEIFKDLKFLVVGGQ